MLKHVVLKVNLPRNVIHDSHSTVGQYYPKRIKILSLVSIFGLLLVLEFSYLNLARL